MRPGILNVLVALILVSCVTVHPQLLVPADKYPPVPPDSVQVFASADELASHGYEWESVALLFADAAVMAGEGSIIQRLREEAGELGANGIIMAEIHNPGFGQQYKKVQVTAIRWRPKVS